MHVRDDCLFGLKTRAGLQAALDTGILLADRNPIEQRKGDYEYVRSVFVYAWPAYFASVHPEPTVAEKPGSIRRLRPFRLSDGGMLCMPTPTHEQSVACVSASLRPPLDA